MRPVPGAIARVVARSAFAIVPPTLPSSSRRPAAITTGGYPAYAWDRDQLSTWVEKAAVAAGKACLKHGKTGCIYGG